MWTKANTVLGLAYIILSAFIVTISSLLIVSFVATKQSMKNTSNFLIVFLSIMDCLNGATTVPLFGLGLLSINSTFDELALFAAKALFPSFGLISVNLTILIGCDRYLHMNPELNRQSRIRKLFKKPKIYILIFCIVVFAIPFSIVEYTWGNGDSLLQTILLTFYSLMMLITMSTLLVVYIRGYGRIRHFVAENPVYSNRGSTKEPEYVRELYKTVLLLLIAMLISYSPACIYFTTKVALLYTDPTKLSSSEFKFSSYAGLLFLFSNSFTNALIIIYRNRKSKTWLSRKVFGCCYKSSTYKSSTDAGIQNNAAVTRNFGISHL